MIKTLQNTKLLFTPFFLSFLLVSCVSDGIEKPSKDQIITDLVNFINQEDHGFDLDKNLTKINDEEEIIEFSITDTKTNSDNPFSLDDDELEIGINLNFIDDEIEYTGDIVVTYILNDKLKWKFNYVNGSISEEFNPRNIYLPTTNRIIRDLVGKRLNTWNFAREAEFRSINIYDQEITTGLKLGEYILTLKVEMELQDYITGYNYTGDILLEYKTNKYIGEWIFRDVSGEVKENLSYSQSIGRIIGGEY